MSVCESLGFLFRLPFTLLVGGSCSAMSDLEYNIKLFAYISHGFPPHQAISIKIRIWFSPNEKKKGRSFVPKLFPRLLLYIWCGQHELHSILLRWLRCVYVHILGMSNTHVTSGKPISQTKYQSRDSVHHGIQSHILFTS